MRGERERHNFPFASSTSSIITAAAAATVGRISHRCQPRQQTSKQSFRPNLKLARTSPASQEAQNSLSISLYLSLSPGNLSNCAKVVVSFCLCKSLQLVVAATRSKKQKKKKKKSFPHDKTIEPNEPKLQKKSADPRNQSGERRRHPVKQLESHRELQRSSVSPRRQSIGWRSGIQSGR
jgi:hypothetical protein